MEELRRLVDSYIADYNITEEEFAQLLGWSLEVLDGKLSGKATVYLLDAIDLASVLGVDAGDLCKQIAFWNSAR